MHGKHVVPIDDQMLPARGSVINMSFAHTEMSPPHGACADEM